MIKCGTDFKGNSSIEATDARRQSPPILDVIFWNTGLIYSPNHRDNKTNNQTEIQLKLW